MTFTKKQLRKLLVPGTWIETKWDDCPNAVELVIGKPDWCRGSVGVPTFCLTRPNADWIQPEHEQVVRIVGKLTVPH
jgi:hypothetical protein